MVTSKELQPIQSLGYDSSKFKVQLVQFANLIKDGSKIKMSTRSGNFYSLSKLIDEVGKDAARFFYLFASPTNTWILI